jgi:hypothetical protein
LDKEVLVPRTECRLLRPLAFALGLACVGAAAAAAPPPNDDFDNAMAVGPLPFADTQDYVEATGAPDDPFSSCGLYAAYTAWYSFTPAADVLVDAWASHVSSVHVYAGPRGNLTQVACGGYQGTVRFLATAGTTYSILVSDTPYSPPPVWVTFNLQEVPPPPPPPVNDELANATVIPALPFEDTTNTLSATSSLGDTYCAAGNTVWYAYTATQDLRLEVNASALPWFPGVSVSTGPPGQWTTIACASPPMFGGSRLRFDAVAGTTYWIMVGSMWGMPGGPTHVSVAQAPPPFVLGLEVERGVVLPSAGQATVHGAVTCNEATWASISGSLRQERAGMWIEGWFSAGAYCEGAGHRAAWSATPWYSIGRFRGRSALLFTGGRAEASVTAYGTGTTSGDYDQESVVTPLNLSGAN